MSNFRAGIGKNGLISLNIILCSVFHFTVVLKFAWKLEYKNFAVCHPWSAQKYLGSNQ
jgi:hypothetical protein